MPRTRIRRGPRLTVTTGGSQTSDGTNPVGSSLTTDSLGSLDIAGNEPVVTPTDAATFALAVTSAETSATPVEASQFFVIMQQVGDTAAVPAEADSGVALVGATTATASAPTGNGWQNPANAQGQLDGTHATMVGTTGLNPPQQSGVLTLSYADVGSPAGAAIQDVRIRHSMDVAILGGTGSQDIATSTDGGANYTQRFASTVTYAETETVLTAAALGLTLANLAQFRVRLTTSVRGTTLATSTATVDAAVVTINL